MIVSRDVHFSDRTALPHDVTDEALGVVPAPYHYRDFKNDVQAALESAFGLQSVRRGDKAIHVSQSAYRIEADVVAAFQHYRYAANRTYLTGIEFLTDAGEAVINWPDQHYEAGVAKNTATSRRYKSVVRILKHLKHLMEDDRRIGENSTPSFLVECLVFNAPDDSFGQTSITADVRHVLANTFNATLTDGECSEWEEVSGLKYLFRGSHPWTRERANAFLGAAWDQIGFS